VFISKNSESAVIRVQKRVLAKKKKERKKEGEGELAHGAEAARMLRL
jgi:hypothetical protein